MKRACFCRDTNLNENQDMRVTRIKRGGLSDNLKTNYLRIKLSLVISTYNKPDYLRNCLKSICFQSELPDEVIVADDGSDEKTREVIDGIRNEFVIPLIHEWQPDLGYRLTRSRNNGIIRSSGDYIIFIDEDIILHKNFIKDHRKVAQKGNFYCGTRVRIGREKTEEVMKGFRNHFSFWENNIESRLNTIRVPFIHRIVKGPQYSHKRLRGCHMAFWKEDLLTVNGFDEEYKSWGRDDSDIALRMMHAGVNRINLKCIAIAYHLHHEVKEPESKNDKLMQETLKTRRIKAVTGLNQR